MDDRLALALRRVTPTDIRRVKERMNGNGGSNTEIMSTLRSIERRLAEVERQESARGQGFSFGDQFSNRAPSFSPGGTPGKGGAVTSEFVTINAEAPDTRYELTLSDANARVISGEYICALQIIGVTDFDKAATMQLSLLVNGRDYFGGVKRVPVNMLATTPFESRLLYPVNARLPSDSEIVAELTVDAGVTFAEDQQVAVQLIAGGSCNV